VSHASLEQTLRDLPSIGTLVKDRPYRQVWRFEHEGRGYYLKFYPREGVRERFHHLRDWFRRLSRGSPAMLEFTRLQALQKAAIPAPRAVAVLMGYRLGGQFGDAVVMEAIEPSVQLDHYLSGMELRGERAPNHRDLSRQLRELVHQLVVAKLGHEDLHLGNLLIKEGKLYLLDGYAVRNGMRARDIYRLAHSTTPFATRTDLLRAWQKLAGGAMPRRNPLAPALRNAFLKRVAGDNKYFGRLNFGDWNGVFFRWTKFAKRWSQVSTITVERQDWERLWPDLWQKIDADQFEILKRTRSGDVLAGEIELGGRTLPVVIKRPRKRYWYRYLNDIPRRSRSWRSWVKGWNLIARNLPTAWPMLVMERRRFGYIADSIAIFERVAGPTLRRMDLESMNWRERDSLFRRTGRILRIIDETGLSHFDAKASNWIVRDDAKLGPSPVLVDTDAVRFRRWALLGLHRLLRSMKEHEQYTPQDSLSLCRGYAPFSQPSAEEIVVVQIEQ
jgi:tRNA A-37 threonylcarbamoyl transferase component Bud32